MKILVVGPGGAGGYFGARWAEAGHDVTVLARGAHLEAIQSSGLTLRSPAGDATVRLRAVADADEVGEVEAVLFATKSWQLPDAIASVSSAVPAGATVFGIQNGVETVSRLSEALPDAHVLGATCRIISLVEEPGVIRHVGIEPAIVLGEVQGGGSDRTARLQDELDLGEALRVEASDDVRLEIWRKFLFFAPVSGVGSVTRSAIGMLRAVPESRALLESAIHEVFRVGRARGVPFEDDGPTATLAFIDGLPEEGTSSMHRDVEAGRPSELEALAGAVVRMGRADGVETPVHGFLYAALRPQEVRARGDGS